MNQFPNQCSPYLYLSPERMKFMLSVADDYEFICPAPAIYYDPLTYQPTFCIDYLHAEYRADFLIRHRENRKAFLVELFPASVAGDPRLGLRRFLAESYIGWKGLDWQYQCLFQEYVLLTPAESLLFASYCQMKNDEDRRQWLVDYLAMSQLLKPSVFQASGYSLLDFLIHGVLPTL